MSIKKVSALFILLSVGFTTATLAGMRAPIHEIPSRAHAPRKGMPSYVHGRRDVGSSRNMRQRLVQRPSSSTEISRRATLKKALKAARSRPLPSEVSKRACLKKAVMDRRKALGMHKQGLSQQQRRKALKKPQKRKALSQQQRRKALSQQQRRKALRRQK